MNRKLISIAALLIAGQFLSAQGTFPLNGPLYTDTTVPTINIQINPDTLAWIYANPESDIEFHAVFVFSNGTVCDTIDPVGFRLRGNTSRYSKKKSFKVSFNTYTPGGKYYGVEKLNLNGEHNDPSVMRSKIMWDILRALEIPAPRANHVRLYINGNYYGLYINVEHIDEEFALSRYGNNNGNLYKCLYPADLDYRGPDPESYKFMSGNRRAYDLTINEDEDNYSDLTALIETLANTSDDSLVCSLDKVFNVYDFLKIMAADIFCGNWDGYIYNKNNYYLYHNTTTGKIEYIPYDVDNTFGIDWFEKDWANLNIYSWQPGGTEKRPLYSRLINHPVLRNQFTFYANQLIDRINIDSLVLSIEARKDMIAPFIADDPYYPLDYGYDYNDFQQSYTMATGAHVKYGLIPFLYSRYLSMEAQLENATASPIIKYIRHSREAENKIRFSVKTEAEALPVTTTLLYFVDDGNQQEAGMLNDGKGSASALLENIADESSVRYQVKVRDGSGQVSIMPCKPVEIRPIKGETPLLFINEIMADNYFTITDEYGNYSDWIEIFNGDTREIFLGDMYLTDNLDSQHKWQLPGTTLPPGGFELFWADGNPGLGDHHGNFKLDKEGETIGLFSEDHFLVDTVSFGKQTQDISYGRESDGALRLVFFNSPTPRSSNSIPGLKERLIIFPNPITGSMLKLSETVTCRIFNSSGLIIFTGREVDAIDIGNYLPGLYILITEDGRSARFIVY